VKQNRGASSSKIKSRKTLSQIASHLRRAGKIITFTNGCFDILHAGHVGYLEKAKKAGDILILGLNSDASVRRLKGPGRPVNSEKDRLKVMAALQAVDYVTLFTEDTPLHLIKEVRPHVLVKGADWSENEIVGGREVKSWGGRIVRAPLLAGRSTTKIIRKIKK
jgi:D-beta-D-heptose 7-phosphate kinase/D-beta-D-heptose 1-phosphate adenosyltransferase